MKDKEFNLSEMRDKLWEGNWWYNEKFIKEFIKISEARISNQLRIHWNWLKKENPKIVAEFVNNIINKRAGEKLVE